MKASISPTCLEEAFDFDLPVLIHGWEIDNIRNAVRSGKHYISEHADQASLDRNISIEDLEDVVLNGKPKSKDLPHNSKKRKPGINFEGKTSNGMIRVKVSWLNGRYTVATVHDL